MLTKARNSGLDWVDQVPLALAAMRQCPSKSTGFSPAELVYGRKTLVPLDFLYYGWKEQWKELWNISDLVEQLCDTLEVIREVAREKKLRIVDERKRIYDKSKKRRENEVNHLVWCRVPGIEIKLGDAWKGLCKVVEKLDEVNYRIVEIGKKKRKPRVVHANTIKALGNSGKGYISN